MMTIEKFYDVLFQRIEGLERDLEEYLLALHKIVLEEQNKTISFELIIDMLAKAFTTKPSPFDEQWLEITQSPRQNGRSRKMTNPDFKDLVDKNTPSDLEGLAFTLEVIKFQAAELNKMRGKQLKDKYKEFGINSETGNRWYNFKPHSNLSCGIRCMIDNDLEEASDWSFIGYLLEDGRIYE